MIAFTVSYCYVRMTGYFGSRYHVGTPQSPKKTPHIPLKISDPLARVLCGLLITSNSLQPAQNYCERVVVCFSVEIGTVTGTQTNIVEKGTVYGTQTNI